MRRKFIAGNWKMNLDRKAAVALAEAVAREAENFSDVDLAVCPPACYLETVGQVIKGSKVAFGAQNIYISPMGPLRAKSARRCSATWAEVRDPRP